MCVCVCVCVRMMTIAHQEECEDCWPGPEEQPIMAIKLLVAHGWHIDDTSLFMYN